MASAIDTNPGDVQQGHEDLAREGERWPSNLPPAPPGRYWDRKINPAYPEGSDQKYIYFTSQLGQSGYDYDESGRPLNKDVENIKDQWELFRLLGYRWLGPGTDISYNLKYNVKPVNSLDAIAMEHDLAYRGIDRMWRRGELSYGGLIALTNKADREFVEAVNQDRSAMGYLSGIGMSAKILADSFFGPSYVTDLSKKGSIADGEDLGDAGDYEEKKGGFGPPVRPPVAPIPVIIDQNNDGIPDVYQRVRRLKKFGRRHGVLSSLGR